MENENLKVQRECLVGHTITAVDFKNYGSVEDSYIRLTLDNGGYWEQRMSFTPAEHQAGIAEQALRQILGINNKEVGGDWDEIDDARAVAKKALKEMEAFA